MTNDVVSNYALLSKLERPLDPLAVALEQRLLQRLAALEQATALFQLSGWCLLQRGEALKEALLESYSERIERAFEFGE